MRASVSRIALLLALLAMASCRDPTVAKWEVMSAKGEWARRGAASYRITVGRDCFCTQEMMGPVLVTVVDGAIHSRHYVPSGIPVPATYAEIFPDIEGLFEIVEEARASGRQLSVAFHPTYSYPTRIAIDLDQRPVDGGVIWIARDLRIP